MYQTSQYNDHKFDEREPLQDWVDGFIRPLASFDRRDNRNVPAQFTRPRIERLSASDDLQRGGWFLTRP